MSERRVSPHVRFQRWRSQRRKDDVLQFVENVVRVSRGGDAPFFVQIGAMDGKRFDPIYEHAVKNKWRGIAVEPMADMCAELRINYPEESVKIVQAAIDSAETDNDTRTMYVPYTTWFAIKRTKRSWQVSRSSGRYCCFQFARMVRRNHVVLQEPQCVGKQTL